MTGIKSLAQQSIVTPHLSSRISVKYSATGESRQYRLKQKLTDGFSCPSQNKILHAKERNAWLAKNSKRQTKSKWICSLPVRLSFNHLWAHTHTSLTTVYLPCRHVITSQPRKHIPMITQCLYKKRKQFETWSTAACDCLHLFTLRAFGSPKMRHETLPHKKKWTLLSKLSGRIRK